MTMTGVILTIVISGIVSLFISHNYLRERMGWGMALMFLLPVASCAAYILLTSPRFNSSATLQDTKLFEQIVHEDKTEKLEETLRQEPDNPDNALALASAYISQSRYDDAISLLESKETPEEFLPMLTTAYFSKGLLFAEQEQYDDALAALQTARAIAPEDIPFLADLDYFIEIVKKQSDLN